MIFNRLFQKAHQHKLPEKRLAAIESLDPKTDDGKRALHELAFNDENEKVTLAALHQLNLFTLWLKAYETHFLSTVREHAEAVVITLIESDQAVPDTLFFELIRQAKYASLVNQLLFNSSRLQQHSDISVEAVLKYCQDHEVRRFFQDHANDAQKASIVEGTDDEKQLKRLKKLDNSHEVNGQIIEKLRALEEVASKPPKIIAAGKLINAKLLALTDGADYLYIREQKQALTKEFEALKGEFKYLSQDDASNISHKYFALKEKLDKRLTLLEPDYKRQVHLSGTSDVIADIEERLNTLCQQISMLAESDESTQLSSQIELLNSAVSDLELEIRDIDDTYTTAAHKLQIKVMLQSLKQQSEVLLQLPSMIKNNAKAAQLLIKAEGFIKKEEPHEQDATEAVSDFKALKLEFEALKNSGVSEGRKKQWQSVEKQHKQQQTALIEDRKQAEKRCISKLGVCRRMIEQGKFKSALAIFKSVQQLYSVIDTPSSSLQKRFTELSEKVGELKDWQSYIALPRKPELIALAEALVKDNTVDIPQRVALVKQYRQEFNSLGKLHTEEDDAFNKAFDLAIEEAFAPCRVFFAEQDKLRASNLEKGEQIVSALQALASLEDALTLNKQIQALSAQYRQLTELDKTARNKLHKRYISALKPLQHKVDTFYADNAQRKQRLVEQASLLNESAEISAAAEQAKLLQQKWRDIGFAGKKQDSALWQAFRQANDAVFARLHDQKNADKEASNAQVKGINLQLNAISQEISSADSLSVLGQVKEGLDKLDQTVFALDKQAQAAPKTKLNGLQSAYQKRVRELELSKEHEQMQDVFDVLAIFKDDEIPSQVASLPAAYKQAFSHQYTSPEVLSTCSRRQASYAIDILFGNSELFLDSEAKKSVQLTLMAAKLQGHDMPSKEQALLHWIAHGKLSEDDLADLTLLKSLFLRG
jgi:hypothetical protein